MRGADSGRYVGILARTVILAALAIASYRAVLLSWSDWESRLGTPEGYRKAAAIMPSSSRFHFLNALSLQQTDPASSLAGIEFSKAVGWDPRDSDALLAWSVNRELNGDIAGAEQLLLRAQQVDRLIRPAWALANFYYRQNRPALFWPQARECLRIIGVTGLALGRFDPIPMYQLCWQITDDPQLILSNAIPGDPVILNHYFAFLLSTHRLDAAITVADLSLATNSPGLQVFYLDYLNQLIDNERMPIAIRTWRSLFDHRVLPYVGPDLANGVFLTNGQLLGLPLHAGFDWRFGFPDSVRFTYSPEHVFRFSFDGSEPERFLVMTQLLPVIGGKTYRLRARYRGDFDAQNSGLHWSASSRGSSSPLPLSVSISKNGTDSVLTGSFDVPLGVVAINLTLTYDRAPGTTRARGDYELLGVELTASPAAERPLP